MTNSMSPISAGFIGIGKMGLPMVTHLRAAGYHLAVCDPVHANVEAARLVGCKKSETVGGCASQADILLSSLPNDAAHAAVCRSRSPRRCARCMKRFVRREMASLITLPPCG